MRRHYAASATSACGGLLSPHAQLRIVVFLWRHETKVMSWRHIMFFVDKHCGLERGLVEKVACLARGLGAEVEVFDCIFDPLVSDSQKIQDAIEERCVELGTVVQFFRELSVHARATVHWAHPPRDGVIRQIRKQPPDLLVIQSKRHSRLARLLLTYSDYKLIETVPCPLWVLKNVKPYDGGRVIAAVDPMHAHDGPAVLDERIVGIAAIVSRAMGMPLHLYHACLSRPEAVQKAEHGVRQLARSGCVPDQQVHIATGDPATLLPQFVHAEFADLLVMGAASRSRIRKALIGHTAEKVLDATDCDLLIVKADPNTLQAQ
jgi:universal stress protein E